MRPLISVPDLANRLEDPSVRIVDTRWYLSDLGQGRREYDAAHIPGAIYLDVETELSGRDGPGRHPLPDPATFAGQLGEVGIGNQHHVVAYDSVGGAVAARLWWMLRHLGHGSVQVLDGGWPSWLNAGHPTTSLVPEFPLAVFVPDGGFSGTVSADQMAGLLGKVRLIDARAGERYRGEIEPVDPKAGHIPTAVSHPYDTNLAADGTFLDETLLRKRYETTKPVVAHCGSGVNACHTLLAHVVAGLPEPLLYEGSWSDWSSADRPIAVGPDPGVAL
ncbi:MAG: sulfurtransferase [Acidimicrobiia bacterium]|nr:sulfurtransferase [Acidimicrobiia bacterium]